MIRLYCKKRHGTKTGLCPECMALAEYAFERSDMCPFMENKTFCSNCRVHCYKPKMRNKIRQVMRFSGPRMIFHHPVMAIRHLICTKWEAVRLAEETDGMWIGGSDNAMYFYGILLGLSSFLSIGVFHPIVIKCEYYFSYRCWPVFLVAGLILLGLSLFIPDIVLSAIIGVVGFSCLWSIIELFHQHKRVEKGWFPANPKHHPDLKKWLKNSCFSSKDFFNHLEKFRFVEMIVRT